MTPLDVQGFETVSATTIVDYLTQHGWTKVSDRPNELAVYQSTVDPSRRATVVLDRDYEDYLRRAAEVAEAISRVEKRSIVEVVGDLLSPPGDQFRIRIRGDSTKGGTLRLEDSLRLREGMRNLMLSAAHSARTPAPHFPRMTQSQALALVDSCRERQSERGSYVAALVVPVSPPIENLSELESDFGRKTTRMLHSALEAAERSQIEPMALLTSVNQGVSANLLESLTLVRPEGTSGSLEMSIDWLGQPASRDRATVRLPFEVIDKFKSAARQLRERDPIANAEVEGYVIALRRVPQSSVGEMTVLAPVEGLGQVRVRVALSDAQYAEAVQAHGEELLVRLRGKLQRTGKGFELVDHTGFERLQEPS